LWYKIIEHGKFMNTPILMAYEMVADVCAGMLGNAFGCWEEDAKGLGWIG
jgi:hypothetical protein